jgi:carbonic anhydrase/acetyltransferase-like protein (isoleucine patch superfamily)
MAIFTLGDRKPVLGREAWVAPNATVIGDVILGDQASIWWNAVVRGDNDTITIGAGSNIQDGSVLHADEGVPLTLGDRVTVGHLVMLHGCTIGEESLIGIKSVILNRAVIGRHCIIGANSLIPEGKVIPDRSLVMGSPGKVVRQLSDEEVAKLRLAAQGYVDNARRYRAELKNRPAELLRSSPWALRRAAWALVPGESSAAPGRRSRPP